MNLPKDFEERMKRMLGEEYPLFEKALDGEGLTGVRIKPGKKELFRELLNEEQRVEWCADGYYCDKSVLSGKHPYHMAGLCYFQEPSAMAVVEAMKINPDDYILDLCAAPGGKATQAGLKLSGEGMLVANEIISGRAQILAENIERMGISNAIVTNEAPERMAERFEAFFDKIIVDAPCSGEGMFRKDIKARGEWSIKHTKACAVRQGHILECAYRMLAPGGSLVYSTCTFAPEENEGAVCELLKNHSDMRLSDTSLSMLDDGRSEWGKYGYDMHLTKRIFPHRQRGEGHFLALMKKDGERQKRTEHTYKTDKKCEEAVNLLREFEKKALNTANDGVFELFGDNLYLLPHGIKADKLRIVRAGLHLGVCKKNRFEPSTALLLSLGKDAMKNKISFEPESAELHKYLCGEAIDGDINGYLAICVSDNPIGWAKGSQGILKNRYPKHLRLLK